MDRIPLSEADGHLAELVDRASRGEEIVFTRDGVPAARLVPVEDATGRDASHRERKLGLAKGRIWIADDFDAPLPDDLLKAFYGLEPDEPWPDGWEDKPA
ncbi:type II toxin-antitoxin system Phd/YefM family antitoxin [Azospirillum thermophilum]|uniref:Antitoxin n=1 Tax=Azospirillum thermophilum TaxID=2202148 RepID=A0A2S2CNS9_9PROT|nr:type II toxin-antitoxin system prevent-host-death family antitoxin [Azospirillum thermophilum]AWK86142.1 hypothetical protein DEW08_07655 [Azospirillum thermophilum]